MYYYSNTRCIFCLLLTVQCTWLLINWPLLRTIVTKVAIDQTVLTIPILCMFFPFMSWCQGKEDIFKELIDKFWLTYMVILETFRNLEIRFQEIFFGRFFCTILLSDNRWAAVGGFLLRQSTSPLSLHTIGLKALLWKYFDESSFTVGKYSTL